MASLFNFGFVRKRAAESQQHSSGPADNEEDREDVEILSPSQPATSTQSEQNLEPETPPSPQACFHAVDRQKAEDLLMASIR